MACKWWRIILRTSQVPLSLSPTFRDKLTFLASQVDNVFRKPYRFFTYIFASMFILINGVQGNALQFGKEIIVAGSYEDTTINQNLQKLFAVIIITLVCQLQAYSRAIYIRISNSLAVFKVTSLLFISLCGVAALTNARVQASEEVSTPYGRENLANAFESMSNDPYQYGLALLNVMRAFLGYENANFVWPLSSPLNTF
jgi:hypothetical protein